MKLNYLILSQCLFVLVVGPAGIQGTETVPTTICGFERPEVIEEIWPVFTHDPGEAAEMEVPQIDVLVDRDGKPLMMFPVNTIPETELKTLRMIIPAMRYSPGNACFEPIESYAKCVFDDYFVLREPVADGTSVKAPQPKWRVSSELAGKLAYYSVTYKESVAVLDFFLDAEGNVTRIKGLTKYGKVLASKLFGPDREAMKFIPASIEGASVESVVRLYLGSGKEFGKETVQLRKMDNPYHSLRNWPEGLPINESFLVDADLILDDDGVVLDVHFLSQMPSELSKQLVVDLKSWKIDPSKIPQEDGPKSMRLKLAYDPESGSPDLLSVSIRRIKYRDPKPIYRRPAHYPASLRRAGVSGVAIVSFVITEAGLVENLEVDFADNREFGDASIEAIREWKFEPAMYNGRPVAIKARQPVPFTISR